MIDAQLEAELARVGEKVHKAKRAVKGLMGQQRFANQLLADLEDELDSLRLRLERTAKEAQPHDHRKLARVGG